MPISPVDRARSIADEPFQLAGTTSAVGGGSGGFVASLLEILRHRELLRLLVGRELKSRYKDSSLGFVWSLVRPLIMLLIYYVAIGQILGASRGVPNFAIFVFSGLTLWGLFSEIVTAGTTSILGNGGLIKKVYLPREIFPVAAIGSALFNFAVQFVVLMVGAVLTGSLVFGRNLLYILPALGITLVYGLAFALALSALNVYLRDVQFLVEVGLQIFFWLSPIVYAWNFVVTATTGAGRGWLEQLYLFNPMSNAILAFQRAIWGDGSRVSVIEGNEIAPQVWPPDMALRLIIVFAVGVVFVWIGHRIFRRLEGNFAQEI
ncbi:ABC transporter permease [Rathayibacter sp. VKM Ac-2856]|uniref:ABC transporter permease n=1 Tax=unclassified Rathayibacter TaxID=2609250 RepID=UPI001564847D|nr:MULTISPECIES: ABC transporter permease [unclassified Rathayibacter]NQX04136.1 ABC transporter permease [Rathayibacter sp. VKM Ac-2858]NQX19305.1 ABC transporter permease [Rathayibacter sp. VKM Ac-2856]